MIPDSLQSKHKPVSIYKQHLCLNTKNFLRNQTTSKQQDRYQCCNRIIHLLTYISIRRHQFTLHANRINYTRSENESREEHHCLETTISCNKRHHINYQSVAPASIYKNKCDCSKYAQIAIYIANERLPLLPFFTEQTK